MVDICWCAGTERCDEAVSKLEREFDIVVNIQGDEPLLEPEIIDEVVAALQGAPDAVYRSAVYRSCMALVQLDPGAMPVELRCLQEFCGMHCTDTQAAQNGRVRSPAAAAAISVGASRLVHVVPFVLQHSLHASEAGGCAPAAASQVRDG